MAQLNFDANQYKPDEGAMGAIPAGWYNVLIDGSELKPTKDSSGHYLQLSFKVIDGQYANRKVWARLNLKNANPVAEEIARGQLSAICHAVGVMNVTDSQQLHNIPLKIRVKLRAATAEYEASNEVGAFKNINENVGDVGGAAPAQQAPQGFNQQPQQMQQNQQFAHGNAPQQPWQQQGQQAPQQMQQQQAPQQYQQQPQQQPMQQQAPQQGQPDWANGQPMQQQPSQPQQQQQQANVPQPTNVPDSPPWAQQGQQGQQ